MLFFKAPAKSVWDVFLQNSHQIVILRACYFFDLCVFSAYPTSCISAPTKPSSCLPRHAVGASVFGAYVENAATATTTQQQANTFQTRSKSMSRVNHFSRRHFATSALSTAALA